MTNWIHREGASRCLAWLVVLTPFAAPSVFLFASNTVFALTIPSILVSSLLFLAVGSLIFLMLIASVRYGLATIEKTCFAYAAVISVGFFFFAIILVGSYYSNQYWGDNLTYEILGGILARPMASLSLVVPHTTSLFLPVIFGSAAIIAVLLLTFSCAYALARIAGLIDLVSDVWKRRSAARCAFAILIAVFGSGLILLVAKPGVLRGEPVLAFFVTSRTSDLMGWDNDRILAALEDRDAARHYRPTANFDKRNVILILVESFRPDRLNINGYNRLTTPFLSELMASGKLTLIEHAHSTCSESFCGIASSLSSRPYHQISKDNFKLNDVLKLNGYKVQYNLSGNHRSWRFLWDFYGENIDVKRDPEMRGDTDETDDIAMLNGFRHGEDFDGTPSFLYFFIMSTHFISTRYPEFERYKPSMLSPQVINKLITTPPLSFDAHGVPVFSPLTDDEAMTYGNHYDDGLLQADDRLRQLFAALKKKDYLKDSIVIIAGDHGESIGERGHILHARYLYEKDMSIPMMIYDDRGEQLQNRHYATQLDIAPTLLAKLGLPQPASWQGIALTDASDTRLTIHQTRLRERPCVAIVDRTKSSFEKYIKCLDQRGIQSEELFDLSKDKAEQVNLIGEKSASALQFYRDQADRRLTNVRCGGNEASCTK